MMDKDSIVGIGLIVFFAGGFVVALYHDDAVSQERNLAVQINYTRSLVANTSGIEKIELARNACVAGYYNPRYDFWLPTFNDDEYSINYCVTKLLGGN